MIYSLLSNGASVLPLFLPGIPQLVLLIFMVVALPLKTDKLSLAFYMFPAIFAALIVISIFSGNERQGLIFLKYMLNIFVAAGVAIGLKHRYGGKFGYVYTRALIYFTSVGILGLAINLFWDWSWSLNIGQRVYHTNFLTSWISDSGFNSSAAMFSPFRYRLQSMFDEPGTFGILLIPALFYSLERKFILWSLVLFLGIFLSESLNAWGIGFFIIVRAIFKSGQPFVLLVFAVIGVLAFIKAFPVLVALYQVKFGIDAAYANVSSFGVRAMEYQFVFSNFWDYILPSNGFGMDQFFPSGVGVSYLRWYLIIGFLSFFILFPFFIVILADLRKIESRNAEISFPVVLAATIFLSGFQRSSFLDHIIFLTLIFWYFAFRNSRFERNS